MRGWSLVVLLLIVCSSFILLPHRENRADHVSAPSPSEEPSLKVGQTTARPLLPDPPVTVSQEQSNPQEKHDENAAAAALDVEPHGQGVERLSWQRQREALAFVVGALEEGQHERARLALAEAGELESGFREEGEGYLLIVECLEARREGRALPSQLVDAAERFIAMQRLAPNRREVRRVCLEGRSFRRND